MCVVIADDSVLLREGIARLLVESGFEVVGQAGDADDLCARSARTSPTSRWSTCACRRPTPMKACARRIGSAPSTPTPPCSCSPSTSRRPTRSSCCRATERTGYLLKDRVADVRTFTDAVRRVAKGGSALDPEVVGLMLGRRRREDPLATLTPREREVLGLMAEGRSNSAMAEALVVSERAVEKHVTAILSKLDLPPAAEDHRRVLAVLRFLRSA